MNTKKKLRPWIIYLVIIISLVGIVYYSYKIITWKVHTEANNKIQDKINKSITVVEPTTEEDTESYKIDFKSLKEINPDTIAYINVNNTNINYIVVKGKDNSYYLKHNFEKKWNIAGWIFGDYRNHFDGTDKNLIIYGHNMKDGSMFDSLKTTLNKEWYENPNNYIITLVTEDNTYYYKVFSNYTIETEDYYITTDFNNDNDFKDFINKLKSRSITDYGIELSSSDKILTLSTCLGNGDKRVVLHAILIKEEKDDTNE